MRSLHKDRPFPPRSAFAISFVSPPRRSIQRKPSSRENSTSKATVLGGEFYHMQDGDSGLNVFPCLPVTQIITVSERAAYLRGKHMFAISSVALLRIFSACHSNGFMVLLVIPLCQARALLFMRRSCLQRFFALVLSCYSFVLIFFLLLLLRGFLKSTVQSRWSSTSTSAPCVQLMIVESLPVTSCTLRCACTAAVSYFRSLVI